ncbi:amidohydrolase family protein [Colwellia sp. E2M01]|uniref:amidohydrolase family protein n=1 Tax=Colwellia sp. E2M01 TaxID=2841561 RepID=UPI001C0865A1|nr:amidohydrolase family protein [Colwellia sp. E2M01]MBU2870654.1 amidohydrolase family protein [Colwellia sp. E2M01]
MTALIIENARLKLNGELQTLYVKNGYYVAELKGDHSTKKLDIQGKLLLPGLIETHLHLDKACIIERCQIIKGDLQEAIEQTSNAKLDFSEEDIFERGKAVLRQAILNGTSYIRTHVEIDPGIGLNSFYAIKRLKDEFSKFIDLQICVFPQEGLTNNPGTEELLCKALELGAEVLGGCPYTDNAPEEHIKRLFKIAKKYDVDLDFHLDFDLSPEKMMLPFLISQTNKYKWNYRVTAGHVTKLSAIPLVELQQIAIQLAEAGISITSLPSTDLFLNGRNIEYLQPRGVTPLKPLHKAGVNCSISTNNIGNPFTPYGDASLIRQANLYANVSQLSNRDDLNNCFNWITYSSAKILGLKAYGTDVGCKADFIVIDGKSVDEVIAKIKQPELGYKSGRCTFKRPSPIAYLD